MPFRINSLKMKCAGAPVLGSDIGKGFGKVPAVTVEVLSVVLALAVGLILGLGQDDGTVLPSAFAVTLGIFDPHLNDVRIVGQHVSFRDCDATLPDFHLNAVICNAKPDGESEGLCQPVGCHVGIGVLKDRNYSARRHGPVESHLETLSLVARTSAGATGGSLVPVSLRGENTLQELSLVTIEWMYSAQLLDHFQNPRNAGELADADAVVELENPVCGDVLRLSLKLRDGRVAEVRFKAKGCVTSMACGSALTELVQGKTVAEARRLRSDDLIALVGALPPASSHAAQLALDALSRVLVQIKSDVK